MKATAEGVLVSWDELEDLLKCVRDGMEYNDDGLDHEQRRRIEKSPVAIDLWKRDRNRCAKVGNALVDAYKEMHPEANVQYAKVIE